mgnify:FL=1
MLFRSGKNDFYVNNFVGLPEILSVAVKIVPKNSHGMRVSSVIFIFDTLIPYCYNIQ